MRSFLTGAALTSEAETKVGGPSVAGAGGPRAAGRCWGSVCFVGLSGWYASLPSQGRYSSSISTLELETMRLSEGT
jgi:hypothetical protein